jgi:NmrA-like family
MKSLKLMATLVLCAVASSWTFWVPEVAAFSLQMSAGKTAVVAGATGYIGKSVVRESVRQGFKTVALVRDKSSVESKEGKALYGQFFEGAEIVECDVCNPDQLTKVGVVDNEALPPIVVGNYRSFILSICLLSSIHIGIETHVLQLFPPSQRILLSGD